MKKVHIFGGGTFSPLRSHLALAAPAFGTAALRLKALFEEQSQWQGRVFLHLTRMADRGSVLQTNEDVDQRLDQVLADPETKVIVFNAALCDYEGQIGEEVSGFHAARLKTGQDVSPVAALRPVPKLLGSIRNGPRGRKDVFLVGFKTTAGASFREQYLAGLNLLKSSSANLVLANDVLTRQNMIIVPEEAHYGGGTDREAVLRELVEMTSARAGLTFTRSTVVGSEQDLVSWADSRIPSSLREVVDYCVSRGAYKPFRGSTAGHFAVKVGGGEFFTSLRKRDFNQLARTGLVRVVAVDQDTVIAHGAKPSVGGQSQRIIFREHEDVDCIVHFHCPLKAGVYDVPIRPQRLVECGSHQCGENTSAGLYEVVPGIKAVMLNNHGPNICFNRQASPADVIAFIESRFDLADKTGGPVA